VFHFLTFKKFPFVFLVFLSSHSRVIISSIPYFFVGCFFSYVLVALGLWQETQAKVCGDMNLGISQAMAYGNN
jgi:hypothetical protein